MADDHHRHPSTHIPMHPLEFQVLLVLLDGALHGYGIAKEIERREGGYGTVQPTNLYRRLRDMQEKGMLSEEPDAQGGQRRLFAVTSFGKEVARAEAERLAGLVVVARQHSLLTDAAGEG